MLGEVKQEERVTPLEIYGAAQAGFIAAGWVYRRYRRRRWIIRDRWAYKRWCRAHKLYPMARIPKGPRKGVPEAEIVRDPWERR